MEKRLEQFMKEKIGGICCLDGEGRLLYANEDLLKRFPGLKIGEHTGENLEWILEQNPDNTEQIITFDQYDMINKVYYKCVMETFSEDGKIYHMAYLDDVSDFVDLVKDVADNAKFFNEMNTFRSRIMACLSQPAYAMLPVIEEYISGENFRLISSAGSMVEDYCYSKSSKYSHKRGKLNEEYEAWLNAANGSMIDDRTVCILSGTIMNVKRYVLLGEKKGESSYSGMNYNTLLANIRLYIENGLMRDEIIYTSEHDALTGLYNKGKYLSRLEEYHNAKTIGIMNFDLNDLKKTNDNLGHEAGDRLLQCAGKSIKKLYQEEEILAGQGSDEIAIHGYRMGGDEYLVIVENCSEEELNMLCRKWEEGLEEINRQEDKFRCVMAVGLAQGAGSDYDELFKLADSRMYEDKKRKKAPGEEIR